VDFDNNPLIEWYGYNNICIVFDTPPASYICPVFWFVTGTLVYYFIRLISFSHFFLLISITIYFLLLCRVFYSEIRGGRFTRTMAFFTNIFSH
jgi:hypothetical protein